MTGWFGLSRIGSVALLVGSCFACQARSENLAISNVTLIDGSGRPPQPGMTVAIENGRFKSIKPTFAVIGTSVRTIDGTGKYLIPGLIDVHVHLGYGIKPKASRRDGLEALAGYLYSGVTTIYDAGNDPSFILPLRADERTGRIVAPRILATGNVITYPGSHDADSAMTIDSWPQATQVLDRHISEQLPDIAKFTYDEHGWGLRPMITLMPTDLLQNAIIYYNQNGIWTTAHASSELRATEAIFAGINSLAHPVIQGPVSDGFVKLMSVRKTPMATTLTIGEGYSRLVEHPEYLDQPLYRAVFSKGSIERLRAETALIWKTQSWTWWMKLMTPVAANNLKRIYTAGGIIAIGTDQSDGAAVHREMELLKLAGIPSSDIIKIATLNGARHLGREDKLGSIEPGKIADAVLLSADPTADIENAKQIIMVIKQGKLIDEDELMLAGGTRPLRRAER